MEVLIVTPVKPVKRHGSVEGGFTPLKIEKKVLKPQICADATPVTSSSLPAATSASASDSHSRNPKSSEPAKLINMIAKSEKAAAASMVVKSVFKRHNLSRREAVHGW